MSATSAKDEKVGSPIEEILDLEKWNLQTIESVREVLARAKAPCIGFSMVFMEMIDKDTSIFKFKTMLAFDPNNPVPEGDRMKLETIFEGYARLAEKVMNPHDPAH